MKTHMLLNLYFAIILCLGLFVPAQDVAAAPASTLPFSSANSTRAGCPPYKVTMTSGLQDGFVVNAPEVPAPSTGMLNFINANYAYPGVRNYDVSQIDRWFAHTFNSLQFSGRIIQKASLEIAIKNRGTNDVLGLAFVDPGGTMLAYWNRSLAALGIANGQSATLTLDLSSLQNSNGTLTDLIPNLNNYGWLDVYVQDDSAVDYTRLTLEYSCIRTDIGVKKNALIAPFTYAAANTYIISVTNHGTLPWQTASGFGITDLLPAGMYLSSAPWSNNNWNCNGTPQTGTFNPQAQRQLVTCAYAGTLAPLATTNFQLPVYVLPAQNIPISLGGWNGDISTNCAKSTGFANGSGYIDPNAANDESCVNVIVAGLLTISGNTGIGGVTLTAVSGTNVSNVTSAPNGIYPECSQWLDGHGDAFENGLQFFAGLSQL